MKLNGFTQWIFSVLLSWMRLVYNWFWSMLATGGQNRFMPWFVSAWLPVVIVLILLGIAIDYTIYLKRWKPDHIWIVTLERARDRFAHGRGLQRGFYRRSIDPDWRDDPEQIEAEPQVYTARTGQGEVAEPRRRRQRVRVTLPKAQNEARPAHTQQSAAASSNVIADPDLPAGTDSAGGSSEAAFQDARVVSPQAAEGYPSGANSSFDPRFTRNIPAQPVPNARLDFVEPQRSAQPNPADYAQNDTKGAPQTPQRTAEQPHYAARHAARADNGDAARAPSNNDAPASSAQSQPQEGPRQPVIPAQDAPGLTESQPAEAFWRQPRTLLGDDARIIQQDQPSQSAQASHAGGASQRPQEPADEGVWVSQADEASSSPESQREPDTPFFQQRAAGQAPHIVRVKPIQPEQAERAPRIDVRPVRGTTEGQED